MTDRTSLLFALPEFTVLDVTAEPGGGRRVHVESATAEGVCPACGGHLISGVGPPVSRVTDPPHGPTGLVVWVRKRRFVCAEAGCPKRSFTVVRRSCRPAPG